MRKDTRQIQARLGRHEWRVNVFQRSLLAWFRQQGRSFPWRDRSASRYEQIVSELLLQRTRAETVAKFFARFVKHFPGWGELAMADEAKLQMFLAPIGLWRRRATSLRSLGREMQIRGGRFPRTRREIEELPGVGQYIASAVLLFCQSGREPLLDVNMARVLERCFAPRKLADIRYDPWLQSLARHVVNHKQAIQINWAVLDLASKVCSIKNPNCVACPVSECCRHANRSGQARTAAFKNGKALAVSGHRSLAQHGRGAQTGSAG